MFKTIKKKVFSVLSFFRVIDENEVLSITNLLVMTFAIKFAMVPLESASILDMAMALAAMGVYMGKKAVSAIIESKKNVVPAEIVEKLKAMSK